MTVPGAPPLVLRNARVGDLGEIVDVHLASGRIVALLPRGSDPPAGAGTIDLEGSRLLPSFVDSHVHLKPWALGMRQVALAGERDLASAVAQVRAKAARLPSGAWVLGGGWETTLLGREPKARDLAGIEAPVAIESRDGHALWCNDRALAAAGIVHGTPDPPGGRIARDERGAPEGVLYENARVAVFRAQPPPSRAEVEETLAEAFARLLALGISEVHDCSYRSQDGCLEELEALDREGKLPLRVAVAVPGDALEAAVAAGCRSGEGGPRIRIGGLKQLADGTLGSQTAALEAPYCGASGTGILCIPPDELSANVRRAAGSGIATWFHAIGDRCLRVVLEALEESPGTCKIPHRIEHAQLTPPPLLARAAALGVTMSVQPSHLLSDMDLARRFWGERTAHAYAYASMERAGLPLAFGSDVPVEAPDPFVGLQAAVLRSREGGAPFHAEQCLSVDAAIAAYTEGGAAAGPWRGEKGRIAPGQLADLVAIAPDPYEVAPDDLPRCRVALHVVGGRRAPVS